MTYNCPYCEDTGYITTPAYQSGGEIIDEKVEKCGCMIHNTDDTSDDVDLKI